jgi:hypothetical protein
LRKFACYGAFRLHRSLAARGVCGGVDWGLWLTEIASRGRTTIEAQARSDGLRLLRIINDTQAHSQEGARADPTRAAHEAGLDGGSERYQDAMAYHIEQAALQGDGLGTVRWTPEGCGDEDPLKGVVSGATDKSTISTPVQGGSRKAHALLREASGTDLP